MSIFVSCDPLQNANMPAGNITWVNPQRVSIITVIDTQVVLVCDTGFNFYSTYADNTAATTAATTLVATINGTNS